MIGDLITIEKKLEYEILLLYVSIHKRKLGYATKLLENIPLALRKEQLKKIYLEVVADNFEAIQLFKKNRYKQTGTRNNYYMLKKIKIDAFFLKR